MEFQWIPWRCWSCHCRCNCIQSELPTFTNSLRDIHMVHTHTRTHHRTHAEHKSRKIQNHQFDWPVKMFDNPVWILASSVNVNTEQCLKFLSPWLHYVHSAAVDNSTTSNQYTTDLLTDWLIHLCFSFRFHTGPPASCKVCHIMDVMFINVVMTNVVCLCQTTKCAPLHCDKSFIF